MCMPSLHITCILRCISDMLSLTVQDISGSQNSSTNIVVSGGMASSNSLPALVANIAPVLLQALLGELTKTLAATGGLPGLGALVAPPSQATQPPGDSVGSRLGPKAASPSSVVKNAQGAVHVPWYVVFVESRCLT